MLGKGVKNCGLEGFVSKLGEAEARLRRAVSLLEQAAQVQKPASGSGPVSESQELAAAKARVANLETINAVATQKLDAAILRVKQILKS